MTFRAIRADKTDAGQDVKLVEMDESELMEGDVTIRVTHSTVNYKDGLALSGKSPVIRRFPMVLGVDLAGIVEDSRRSDFAPGDEVVLTGHGLSETHYGGYAERARVNGDWLVKLPDRPHPGRRRWRSAPRASPRCWRLMAIERHDLTPSSGPALVTGAAGGVGSMAITLFAGKGWRVIASTGRRSEAAYLKTLGADEIIDRATLSAPGKPLGKEQWAAAVDSVGSTTLANVIAQTRYGGAVAVLRACGRHGPAHDGRAVHPARRLAPRDRQRPLPCAAPARSLAAPRPRSRPRQARDHDPEHHARRGVRRRGPHP